MTIDDAALTLYHEYRDGRFPMADTADGPIYIVTPRQRALLPIADLHISRSLLKAIKKSPFQITVDTAFSQVVAECALSTPSRPDTWISQDIRVLFDELFRQGKAHSIECWHGGMLAGGLYGLEVGAVFCGESMFSRVTNASKIALVNLCARLWAGGFHLLDAQFSNPHLEQFGVYTMSQKDYVARLKTLRDQRCNFFTNTNILSEYLKMKENEFRFQPEGKG